MTDRTELRPAETVSESSSIERLIQRKKAEDPEIAAAYDMAELRRWLGDMRSLAELEGIYDGNASVRSIVVRVLPMLDRLAHMTEARDSARAEVERLGAQVEAVRKWATACATQATDYDEDTEQQIEDGRKVLRILDATPGGESS